MYILCVFGVGLGQIHFLEIVYSHFQVSSLYLYVYDDLFVSSAGEGISVLLVGGEGIGDEVVGGKFKFGELALGVESEVGLFLCCDLEEQYAFGAGLFAEGCNLIGDLCAFLFVFCELVKAFGEFFVWFAESSMVKRKALFSADFEVDFLTVVKVVECLVIY